MNHFYNILCLVAKKDFSLIIGGDFNVKFDSNSKELNDISNLLESFGVHTTVKDVTRPGLVNSGNCIDNIVTNIHHSRYTSIVINTVISDHNAILFKAKIKD